MDKPVPTDESDEITPGEPTGETLPPQRFVQIDFSGPLPPPEVLNGYENTLRGSADRIIRMAERQQNHHLRLEVLGWVSGTLIIVIVLIGSIWIISLGQSLVGFAGVLIATSGLIANFLNFLNARRSPPEDRNNPDSEV